MYISSRSTDAVSADTLDTASSEVKLTVPNIITLAGIFAIAIYVLQIGLNMATVLIPITVSLVVLSDLMDGPLARRMDQETTFGRLIDHLRDRLLLFAGVGNIYLIEKGLITFSLLVFVLVSGLFSFLRKDLPDFRSGRSEPESRIVKISYALTFCATVLMAARIYWSLEFLPSVHFFAVIFLATGTLDLLKTFRR